jgi:hypothetical protein
VSERTDLPLEELSSRLRLSRISKFDCTAEMTWVSALITWQPRRYLRLNRGRWSQNPTKLCSVNPRLSEFRIEEKLRVRKDFEKDKNHFFLHMLCPPYQEHKTSCDRVHSNLHEREGNPTRKAPAYRTIPLNVARSACEMCMIIEAFTHVYKVPARFSSVSSRQAITGTSRHGQGSIRPDYFP